MYLVLGETLASAAGSVRNPEGIEQTECRLDCVAVVHGILDQGCGDAPARAIIDGLASRMRDDLWYRAKLEELLDDMEERLRRVGADPRLRALGCSGTPHATLDLILVQPGRVRIVHVGDGRVYRWRRGTLEQLTRDHTLGQSMREQDDHQAIDPRHANVRLRALGLPSPPSMPRTTERVDVRDEPVERDDRIIACTPGVWEDIGDDGIASCLGGWPADGRALEDGCNALRARVLAGPSKRPASFVVTVAR
jgi:serine/threonine protein phosphatase PrpC